MAKYVCAPDEAFIGEPLVGTCPICKSGIYQDYEMNFYCEKEHCLFNKGIMLP